MRRALVVVAAMLTAGTALAAPANAAAAAKIRLDMKDCDGDTTSPVDETTWNATASGGTVGSVQTICALPFDASEVPSPGDVTLAVVSGPGHLTDVTGQQNLGSSATVHPGTTYNVGYVISTVAGTTTVRVSTGTLQADGTKAWVAAAPRIVSLGGLTGTGADTSRTVTATVRDLYGNPVAGVTVTFTQSGVGRLSSPAQAVTGTDGTAQATVARDPDASGTQTIFAAISPSATDCNRGAGDPAGAPAGVCTASITNSWNAAATQMTIAVTPIVGVWGTTFSVDGVLSGGGQGVGGRYVSVLRREGFTGDFHSFQDAITGSDGRWAIVDRPDRHVQYRAVFAGDDQVGSSTSAIVTAAVRVGIVLNVNPARARAGSVVAFSGRVLPEHPGSRVALQQYSPTSGWRTVAWTRLDANSSYWLPILKRSAGYLIFRTAFASDGDHLWNVSVNRRVDWQ